MRDELKKHLITKYPQIKPAQVEKYVNNYVDAVLRELERQFAAASSEDILAGEISFAEEAVAIKCRQATFDGTRMRVYAMMQMDTSTALVIVTHKGNSHQHRVSKVTLNPKYKKEIFKALINEERELDDKYLDELDGKANYTIPIDMDALLSYIRHTVAALQRSPSHQYTAKLYRNLSAANQIKQRAVAQADGSYIVKEYWEVIDSGRAHGHGLSLQRVAKEVRHAALGRCVKIDFKASSYAVMTSIALAINPNLKVEAIKEYIKNRTAVRKRIAKQIGVSDERMKTIFTAMGFGADLKNNPFSSIRRTLGQTKYDLLVANSEFAHITQAHNAVRKTILKHDLFKGVDFLIGNYKYSALDKAGTKRSPNQKLAWIYQACERMALDIVIEKMPSDYAELLPVHDCLYIKQALPSHVMLDLKYELQQIFPLLTFEQEIVIPIHAAEDHSKYNDALDAEENAHKLRIAGATSDARDYKSANVAVGHEGLKTADYRDETDEQYERRRKLQFMLDLHKHEKQREADDFE
jgi:hypothetical protein